MNIAAIIVLGLTVLVTVLFAVTSLKSRERYTVIQDSFGQLQKRGVGGWGGGTVTGSTRGNFQVNGTVCNRGCWAGDGAMRITPECQFSYPPQNICGNSQEGFSLDPPQGNTCNCQGGGGGGGESLNLTLSYTGGGGGSDGVFKINGVNVGKGNY